MYVRTRPGDITLASPNIAFQQKVTRAIHIARENLNL
jgi:hypothetical protein